MRSDDFHRAALQLDEEGTPYVIVTVLRTTGSSSAKPGAKALILRDGRTFIGWIGGGCIESEVREAALASFKRRTPTTLMVDLNDEVTSVPCGGTMELFLEPIHPAPLLQLIGRGKAVEALVKLGRFLGLRVSVFDPGASSETYPQADYLHPNDPGLTALQGGEHAFVLIATHHKHDIEAISHCLKKQIGYIGLIASQHRTRLIKNTLRKAGYTSHQLASLRAPAGVDLGGRTPEEMAFSVMTEILQTLKGGTGRPLSSLRPEAPAGQETMASVHQGKT